MYSHPGKELHRHLTDVRDAGMIIFKAKRTNWSADNTIQIVLELMLLCHDLGKGTNYFQEYLTDTVNGRITKWRRKPDSELKQHGLFSALWVYLLLKEKTGQAKYALFGYLAVLKHHGNLVNLDRYIIPSLDDKIDCLSGQLAAFDAAYFKEYLNLDLDKEKFSILLGEMKSHLVNNMNMFREVKSKLCIRDYILFNFLYSILISADKGDAIFYAENSDFTRVLEQKAAYFELDDKLADTYKAKTFLVSSPLNNLRDDIYNEVGDNLLCEYKVQRIFSINVPTGTGKTLTALNAALKLRSLLKPVNYKIIYALPFTSIIDQNFDVFKEVLNTIDSSVLLKHHHLAEKKMDNPGEELEYNYNISEYLVENWDSQVVVTTFVQLLHSLLSNNNRKLKKFHNIANSIIILDEVQSIPYKYWKLLNVLFTEFSRVMDCYVILVTATMPLIFSRADGEIKELAVQNEKYFKAFNRITIDLSHFHTEMQIDEFTGFIKQELIRYKGDGFLIVLNTIKSSLKVYAALKDTEDYMVIYLSTNIIPKERRRRIDQIKAAKKVLVISTQLVEAGVDIDLNRVYRDMAPLDSIIQAAGRANRNNGENKGVVIPVKLHDGKRLFAEYIYDKAILLNTTNAILMQAGNVVDETQISGLAEKYFAALNSKKSDDPSDDLIDAISTLQYKSAFEGDYDTAAFELIKQEFKTVDLFICTDDEAVSLWQVYLELQNLKPFERKTRFNAVKAGFLAYVLSIPEKEFPGSDNVFKLIDRDMVNQYYKAETGFIWKDQQTDYFF